MKSQIKKTHLWLSLSTILLVTSSVATVEVKNDVPSNHKQITTTPSVLRLKLEPRGVDDGLDLNAVEQKSKSSSLIFADNSKSSKPQISGSTSKVAVVYSERKPLETDKPYKPSKPQTEERTRRKPLEIPKSKNPNDERNWRIVKVSSRDTYLDALDHSHTSNDPREGVVRADTRPKVTKLIRRDYHEGPVYRPSLDQFGNSKSSSTYGSPGDDNHAVNSNNFARISYGGPTPEPFLPTPSDGYTLPVQSSVNFNNGGYASHQSSYGPPQPQATYGSPQPQTTYGSSQPQTSYGLPQRQTNYGTPQPQTSYGSPNNHYGSPSSNHGSAENSYGNSATLPQTSYGPPNNGYHPSGVPHQAYGPSPSSSYGVPFAIQDYSQHLPSLPSIDFSWPLALKLNAFTLAKILLKLVIFKMIVKFIAVICLLMFIPKLEIIKKGDKDESNDDDEGRRLLASDSALERLNILTALVTSSIEKYEKETEKPDNSDDNCTSLACRVRKFLTFDQSWNDYIQLFKTYVSEETNNDEDKETLTNRIDT